MVLSAALVGGALGAMGARFNRVRTGDEFALWIAAGIVGGPLSVGEYALIMSFLDLRPGLAPGAFPVAFALMAGAGVLGALWTPSLDDSDVPGRWMTSLFIKWVRSPLTTTAGLLMALAAKLRHRPVDFGRGMLFVDVGQGGSALTLGAVGWCQARCFSSNRCMSDPLARHEAVHSRTVAAVGELGFYLTYVTAGVLWARIQEGPWNSLNRQGCGQPFEKTAHTYTADPAVANPCRKSAGGGAKGGQSEPAAAASAEPAEASPGGPAPPPA